MIEDLITKIKKKNKKKHTCFSKEKNKPEEQGLIVSAGHGIYALKDKDKYLIALRPYNYDIKLLYYNNNLYDSNQNVIFNTLTGEIIALRKKNIRSFAFNDNRMYDATEDEIFETKSNKVIAKRSKGYSNFNGGISHLVSNKSRLYDCGSYNEIYDTLKDEAITARAGYSNMISHNERLYDSSNNFVFETKTGKIIGKRDKNITNLFSGNGKLYDCCYNQLFDTFNNKLIAGEQSEIKCASNYNGDLYAASCDYIFDTSGFNRIDFHDKNINDMCNVPFSLFNKLINKGVKLDDSNSSRI